MMKKWMIRFMSVLAVFALGVGTTGCGQAKDNGTEDSAMEEQADEAAENAEEAMDESVDAMDKE